MSLFSDLRDEISYRGRHAVDWVKDHPKESALIAAEVILIATPMPKTPVIRAVVKGTKIAKRLL